MASILDPLSEITVEVTAKLVDDYSTILILTPDFEGASLVGGDWEFVQTLAMVQDFEAMHKYGAFIIPANADANPGVMRVGSNTYTSTTNIADTADVGDTFTFELDTENPKLLAVSFEYADLYDSEGSEEVEFDPDVTANYVKITGSSEGSADYIATSGSSVSGKKVTALSVESDVDLSAFSWSDFSAGDMLVISVTKGSQEAEYSFEVLAG